MKDENQNCAVSATGSDSQRTLVESTHRHTDHLQPTDMNTEMWLNAKNFICIKNVTCKDMVSSIFTKKKDIGMCCTDT